MNGTDSWSSVMKFYKGNIEERQLCSGGSNTPSSLISTKCTFDNAHVEGDVTLLNWYKRDKFTVNTSVWTSGKFTSWYQWYRPTIILLPVIASELNPNQESFHLFSNKLIFFISVLVVVIFMAFCVVHLVCSTNKGSRIIRPTTCSLIAYES